MHVRSDPDWLIAMKSLHPFLWLPNGQAEAAAAFYVGVFGDGAIHSVLRYPEGSPQPSGAVMTVDFDLGGHRVTALNADDRFSFTPALSLVVLTDDQAETDRLWDGLMDGGSAMACGWLTDRFGITWQIVPAAAMDLFHDPDPQVQQRVNEALMPMVKIDLGELQAAAERD